MGVWAQICCSAVSVYCLQMLETVTTFCCCCNYFSVFNFCCNSVMLHVALKSEFQTIKFCSTCWPLLDTKKLTGLLKTCLNAPVINLVLPLLKLVFQVNHECTGNFSARASNFCCWTPHKHVDCCLQNKENTSDKGSILCCKTSKKAGVLLTHICHPVVETNVICCWTDWLKPESCSSSDTLANEVLKLLMAKGYIEEFGTDLHWLALLLKSMKLHMITKIRDQMAMENVMLNWIVSVKPNAFAWHILFSMILSSFEISLIQKINRVKISMPFVHSLVLAIRLTIFCKGKVNLTLYSRLFLFIGLYTYPRLVSWFKMRNIAMFFLYL